MDVKKHTTGVQIESLVVDCNDGCGAPRVFSLFLLVVVISKEYSLEHT